MDIESKCMQTMQAYAAALVTNDEHGILQLFTPDARVISYLVGEKPVAEFFKNLFANRREKLTIHHSFVATKPHPTGALHFSFDAIWQEKATLHVEAVDIFEFDDDGRITLLRIIMDTQPFRTMQARFQQESMKNCL